MYYVLLSTPEEYAQLNDAVSTSRGYPYRSTLKYAPALTAENEEQITHDVVITPASETTEAVTETKYKFPICSDILTIFGMLRGAVVYNENMVPLFSEQ